MDGQHSTSAGNLGFQPPTAGGVPPAYEKLYQVAWSEQMAATGYFGGP